MESKRIRPVRGMNDVLPDAFATAQAVTQQMQATFAQFGYHPIDVPLVEHTELYLRKSGEEIVTRMYDFVYQNRRLCLRPEMTASIIRAYVEHLENRVVLPVRLHYSGPVFRYERPQRERHRQFMQVGVELLGGGGPMADAEVIWTACKALDQLGLKSYRVVIGHIGVLTKFLANLQLSSRLQNLLLASTELLRSQDGRNKVEKRLQEIYPNYRSNTSLGAETADLGSGQIDKLIDLFAHLNDADAKAAILELLNNLNVNLEGRRSSEEIATRLLDKIHRQDWGPKIDQALAFMTDLSALEGEPFSVLEQGKALLPNYGIDTAPLEELRAIMQILKRYDLNWDHVSLDLGLSRGLQYYTGTIFEIHHGSLGEERQICGGGRYDDLVTTLGGDHSTPATGFSFGLERVCVALASEENLPPPPRPVDAFVVALDAEQQGYAVTVAEQLRSHHLNIELAIRDRSISNNFQYAEKQNIPFVIVVGSEEQAQGTITLRPQSTKAGERMTLAAAATQLLQNRTEAQA